MIDDREHEPQSEAEPQFPRPPGSPIARWLRRFRHPQPVPSAAHGLDDGLLARPVELAAQVADVDVHDVALRIEAVSPDAAEDLGAGENLALVSHQELEQSELPRRQIGARSPRWARRVLRSRWRSPACRPKPRVAGCAGVGPGCGRPVRRNRRAWADSRPRPGPARDPGGHITSGGQHDDGCLLVGLAQLGEHGEPVDIG